MFSSRRPEPQERQGAGSSRGGGVSNPGKLPGGGWRQVQPPAIRSSRQPRQEEDKSAQGEMGRKDLSVYCVPGVYILPARKCWLNVGFLKVLKGNMAKKRPQIGGNLVNGH